MGIVKGEEVETKGVYNIFNKIITENFPNLEKELPIQVQEVSSTPKRLPKIEPPHGILSLRQQAQRTQKEY
jgi:hypothetical protein